MKMKDEIGRRSLTSLPESCIADVISFIGPVDACRLETLSSTFRDAAQSDTVWEKFLPPDYRSIITRSSDPSLLNRFSSKKQLYLSLCQNPILIDNGKKSFSLEKGSGKKCYMLSARDLRIVWSETPTYWRWISLPDSRFPQVAELIAVCWFDISGKFNTNILSPSTLYVAYLVYRLTRDAYGFEHQPAEVTLGLAGSEISSKHNSYLDVEIGQGGQYRRIRRRVGLFRMGYFFGVQAAAPSAESDRQYPKEIGDGWLEIELGEFFSKEGEEGELEMSVLEVKGGHWKGGLIIQGIEIRPKKTG